MAKDFKNTDAKSIKRKEPVSTNPFTEPVTKTWRGLADEGVDQTRIDTNPGTKQRISGQATRIADAKSHAGEGGRSRV